jgi:hypothetical protein
MRGRSVTFATDATATDVFCVRSHTLDTSVPINVELGSRGGKIVREP